MTLELLIQTFGSWVVMAAIVYYGIQKIPGFLSGYYQIRGIKYSHLKTLTTDDKNEPIDRFIKNLMNENRISTATGYFYSDFEATSINAIYEKLQKKVKLTDFFGIYEYMQIDSRGELIFKNGLIERQKYYVTYRWLAIVECIGILLFPLIIGLSPNAEFREVFKTDSTAYVLATFISAILWAICANSVMYYLIEEAKISKALRVKKAYNNFNET